MKNFFWAVSKYIDEITVNEIGSQKTVDEIKDNYLRLSTQEKKESINLLREAFSDNNYYYIMILNLLLSEAIDIEIAIEMHRVLDSSDITIGKKIVMFKQLVLFWFLKCENQKLSEQLCNTSYNIIIEEINSNIEFKGVKSAKPNKSVVLMISPIIGEKHAPTKILANMTYYLKKMGYDVISISTEFKGLQEQYGLDMANRIRVDCSLFSGIGKYNVNILDVDILGINFSIDNQNIIQCFTSAKEFVYKYNPEYIISIGGANYMADIFSKEFNLITIATTSSLPITCANNIFSYFGFASSKKNNCNIDGKTIYEIDYKNVKQPKEEPVYRTDYGMSEKDFVVEIVGNRLNIEITDQFLDILDTISEIDNNIKFLFIGNDSVVKEKVNARRYCSRSIFTGSVSNFTNTVALGDVFLNPKRTGGGSGAFAAIAKEIPVITLKDCDVAFMSGDEFTCDTLDEMPELVERYINDAEFMEKQKEACRRNVALRSDETRCIESLAMNLLYTKTKFEKRELEE